MIEEERARGRPPARRPRPGTSDRPGTPPARRPAES